MMGYRDPNIQEWEIECWDEMLKEFGVAAYLEARYGVGGDPQSFDEPVDDGEHGLDCRCGDRDCYACNQA